ncbi:hypothetical protein [Tenacibaculum amylolyticum]|uniref:hypothetical protein n=1 Tax=Tenacibaculum amylolyticum TaxID=104269 RepID=UPI003893DEDF
MIFAIIIPVVLILFFLIYYFSNKQTIIRKLRKIPSAGIGSIRTNQLVKVTGKALHVHEPLVAPFSKRKCVFFRIKIEQKKSSGKSSHWSTILKEERIQDFFIDKNGTSVMVQPSKNLRNYKAHLVVDKHTSSGTFKDPSPEFLRLLKEYNIKSTGFFGFNKQLRYSEAIVEIGEEVTVAGTAKWKNLNEPVAGYDYSNILALESTNQQKLIITDLSKKQL